MPIEIKELIIRAIVADDADAQPGQAPRPDDGPDHEALVQECVREVLRILEASRER